MSAAETGGGPMREPEHPSYDPWALLGVVLNDLSVHAVKSRFGGDLSAAVLIAADLLRALGVRPVIAEDEPGES